MVDLYDVDVLLLFHLGLRRRFCFRIALTFTASRRGSNSGKQERQHDRARISHISLDNLASDSKIQLTGCRQIRANQIQVVELHAAVFCLRIQKIEQ